GLVEVRGDGLALLVSRHLAPAELPTIAVPVAHELIDQARGQVGAGVHADLWTLAQPLPHLLAVDGLRRPPERPAAAPLLDVPHDVRELRAGLSEPGVIRQ